MLTVFASALRDLHAGYSLRPLWFALASEDLADTHRRTWLGHIWHPISYLLFVLTIVFIFRPTTSYEHYLSYVASGLLAWLFIAETLTQGTTLFTHEAGLIKGTVLPLTVFVLRQMTRTMLRTVNALIVAVPLIVWDRTSPEVALATVPLSLALLAATAPAVGIIFGMIGVYVRDFQFVVSNGMRLLMFATPVFWVYEGQGGLRGLLYHWNPLTHYIDIVRQPVVEGVVPLTSWGIVLALTALLWLAALLLLGSIGRQIVFRL